MRAEPTSTGLVPVEERGIALIAALMIMLLMSALMIGFTTVIMTDQRYRGIDKDRTRAFYGAMSGIEKLSADFGNLFDTVLAPTAAQITALGTTPPVIPGVTYVAPAGVVAYGVTLVPCQSPPAVPVALTTCTASIQTGPYQGLIALKQDYTLDAVARTSTGGEAHLTRKEETVAIPVFQFGMFSNVDLSFFAGPAFNFGGRVHTNGNLFLAEGGGNVLTLTDKVTVVGDVIRTNMQNGVLISNSPTHDGNISMATAPNAFRNLLATEGSLLGGFGSAANPSWHTISLSTYNGYIRNGGCPTPTTCAVPPRGTGAKVLNLPVITAGGANTALTRRPQQNENATSPVIFGERMFGKVSLRILLSDKATNITNLPTVTAIAPVLLDGNWTTTPPNNGSGTLFLGVGAAIPGGGGVMPPIARSPGSIAFTTSAATAAGDTTVPFNVAGFPATYHRPTYPLAITSLGPVTNSVTCTSVTPTQLIGCKPAANWQLQPTGATFSVVINGVTYTASVNGIIALAANKNARTLNINAGANPAYPGTSAWSTNTFWMTDVSNSASNSNPNGNSNYPTLVTCTGVDSTVAGVLTQFSGCSNVPQTNNGSAISTNALSAQDTGLVGGYLKIEMQDTASVWHDVTMEILNWGFAAPNQVAPNQSGSQCNDPTPNAIIRFQRLKDNGGAATPAQACANSSLDPYDYWPNVLFDPREGIQRDVDPGTGLVTLGGLMNYVMLDVANLSKWLKGTAPYAAGTGVNSYSNNGYGVYFSDRRNNVAPGPYPAPPAGETAPPNVDVANLETGEYGFEDFVNPLSAAGVPNSTLDGGEDVNGNTVLDTYGEFPSSAGVWNALPAAGTGVYSPANISAATIAPNTVRPWNFVNYAQGMVNRTYLFRRALKLFNGGQGNIVTPGLTVVTENPVYIHGDWNWNGGLLTAAHSETSVIADAVSLLTTAWTDQNSFLNPYNPGNRTPSANAWFRLAVIAGKGIAFPWPSAGGPPNDYGTDGGAHNFLRLLEGGGTVNYQGAIATFYYNRQAVGTYKCCNTVYGAPTRNFNFDTDFLNPATLPPFTPVFRDVNALGFAQEIRPGK